jgi:hypothetical protein
VLVIVNHPDSLQPNRIQSSMLRLPQQSQQYKQVEVHTSDWPGSQISSSTRPESAKLPNHPLTNPTCTS